MIHFGAGSARTARAVAVKFQQIAIIEQSNAKNITACESEMFIKHGMRSKVLLIARGGSALTTGGTNPEQLAVNQQHGQLGVHFNLRKLTRTI